MRTCLARAGFSLLAIGASLATRPALAATLQVGPGQTYATPCAAIGKAKPDDEVDVAAGTYTDSCEIAVAGLTVKGVGGQPKIDVTTTGPAQQKGIYIVSADDVRIENLELTGAQISQGAGGNGAGLRVTGHGLVVHGCYIHDNQDGILAAPIVDGGTITIEYTELSHNGLGAGCDNGGCTHNVYVSKATDSMGNVVRYDQTIFQFNWTHDLADDTADKGHLLKSRSRETDVLYNRITGETGHESLEVDIPNAGLGIVVGNVIQKSPDADGNEILLDYGEEGVDPGQATTLYVVSNTFVNDFTAGSFVAFPAGATLTAHDNIFYGPGKPASSGSVPSDNLAGPDPLFADPANYNYHLMAGSPAIGKAVDPGSAGTFSLTPAFEYVQPLMAVARATDHDVGAFEYGTTTSGAGQDAGTSVAGDASGASGGGFEGGAGGGTSGGGTGANGTGGTGAGGEDAALPGNDAGQEQASGQTGGCGCVVAGEGAATGGQAMMLGLAGLGGLRGRRRHRTSRWGSPVMSSER